MAGDMMKFNTRNRKNRGTKEGRSKGHYLLPESRNGSKNGNEIHRICVAHLTYRKYLGYMAVGRMDRNTPLSPVNIRPGRVPGSVPTGDT
jgi:hypothetical protein